MHLTHYFLASLFVITIWPTPSVHADEIDVFFYSGQSNASGRISTGYAPDPRDADVKYYYRTDGPSTTDVTSGGAFTSLSPIATGYYGAEISMGRALIDSGYNPAIIKISDGGTSLAGGWTSRRDGVWWNHWKTDVTEALADLETQGYTINLRAFFWMQGESDAHESKTANFDYEEDFTFFVKDVRNHLSLLGYESNDVAFITAMIQDFNPPHSGIVRAAQQAVMEADALGGWFDTADFGLMDDIHYDAEGVEILGHRFAEEFAAIHNAAEPSNIGLLLIPAVLLARRIKRPTISLDKAKRLEDCVV